ncbi:MAG: AAA family ATPase, partial [Candidatus Bathyarchaeia archaeon]
PLPNLGARREIFKIHTKNTKLGEDVDFDKLAKLTENYTGADIAAICNTAIMLSIKEHLDKYRNAEEAKKNVNELKVMMGHFENALEKVKPISEQELKMYERAAKQFVDSLAEQKVKK